MPIAGHLGWGGEGHRQNVERALTALSLSSISFRFWHDGDICFGACDGAVVVPKSTNVGGITLVLDGNLHNRDELRRLLGLNAVDSPADSDILLAAYSRWGVGFLGPVAGEFACALWDSGIRRLLLGTDILGNWSLYHWSEGLGQRRFASEPRGLLACPDVPKQLNESYVAEWLALLPDAPTECLFAGIERVPGGHVLVVEGEQVRLERYWRPEDLPMLRLPRDEDYAEALRECLDEAVRCRLPASGDVGCYLSGGLDSTSVAVLAARHLAKQGRKLIAFTAVPEVGVDTTLHANRICDEGDAAAAVARMHPNIEHVRVNNHQMPLQQVIERQQASSDWPLRATPNLGWFTSIGDEARRRGIKVMLSGAMGNMTISYDGMMLPASLLRRGKLWDLGCTMAALRRQGRSWLSILNQILAPLFPGSVNLARRMLGRFSMGMDLYAHSAILPAFARTHGVEQWAHVYHGDLALAVGGDSRAFRLLVFSRFAPRSLRPGIQRQFGFDFRDPTVDRRVIELCLSIPDEQFLYKGEPRSAIRRAMAGLLPPEVMNEPRRGLQAADWFKYYSAGRAELVQELERISHSSLACRSLDLVEMRRLLDNWPSDPAAGERQAAEYQLKLGRGITMGRFIRHIEGGNG